MSDRIIPEDELEEGWYLGHSESRYPVAYWDPKHREFISLNRKFDDVVMKYMNHWNDDNFAAFGPIKRLEENWKRNLNNH